MNALTAAKRRAESAVLLQIIIIATIRLN